MVTWVLVAAAMAFTAGPTSFYILRFLLGVTEAGFFPGMILYLTLWFPRQTRARSTGVFYFGFPCPWSSAVRRQASCSTSPRRSS